MAEPTPGDEALIRAYLTAQQAPVGQRADSFAQFLATQPQGVLPSPFVEGAPSTAPDLSALASPVDPAKQIHYQRRGLDLGSLPPAQAAQAQALLPPAGSPSIPRPRASAPTVLPEVTVRPGPSVARAPAGPPPWLRKAMGAEAEGTIQRPKTLTVQPLTAEGRAALDEADTEAFGAKRAQGEASIQAAQDIADQAVKAADEQEATAARFAEREADRQRHLASMEADYRDMADRITNTPIEAPDFWGGKDAGSQILGRIALFLGTVGSGVSGQPNIVWQKMSGDVERNIEIQKANKALQTNRLAAEGTLIGMARERFASAASQDAVMRQAAYEKIRMQLEAYKEQARTPERAAALDALMAEADQALTQADEQRRALMETGELNERRARAALSARPDPLAALVKRSGQLRTLKENERAVEGGVDPKDLGPVPLWKTSVPKESAKEARDLSANIESLKGMLADYGARTTAQTGTGAAQDELTIGLKKLAGQGFSSDSDMALLRGQIPDPSNPGFRDRIDQLKRSVQRTEAAAKRSLGVPVVGGK